MLKDFLYELFGLRFHGLGFERVFWTLITIVGGIVLYRLHKARQQDEAPPDQGTRLVIGGGMLAYGAYNALRAWFSTKYQLFFTDPLVLHTYGVAIATGFVVAIWMGVQQARRTGLEPVKVLDFAFYALVAGLLGSRIAFMMVEWQDYYNMCFAPEKMGLAEPDCLAPLRFWQGGLVFYGGLILATLVAFWFFRKNKLPGWRYADALAPSVAMGQFFGRLGCLAAGCCHGKYCPPDKLMAIQWEPGTAAHKVILPGLADGAQKATFLAEGYVTAHPTQLYESSATLLLVIFLILMRPYKRFDGQVLAMYIMAYALIRSTIELFRGDKIRGFLVEYTNPSISEFLGLPLDEPLLLSTSQFISLMMFVSAVAIWVVRSRATKREAAEAAKSAA